MVSDKQDRTLEIFFRGLRGEDLGVSNSMKRFTTSDDRPKLSRLIQKEIYHYSEVGRD